MGGEREGSVHHIMLTLDLYTVVWREGVSMCTCTNSVLTYW